MTHRRKQVHRTANKRVDEHLTAYFIEGIHNLPDNAKSRYLKQEFLKKFVSHETDPHHVRRQRAINKWLSTECNNEATNTRLLITRPDFNILPGVTYERFVEKCQQVVVSIIGHIPEFEFLMGSFSGGATTSRKRTESHPTSKYLGQADITIDAYQIFLDLFEEMPGWASFRDNVCFNIVPGNILFTVPKTAEIDRVACKEPDINMFMQKGLGASIRRGLKRAGVDLNDQSINRRLACEGSITGDLATLDLSSASDSVTYQLVQELLPPTWFVLLDAVRSKVTSIDGIEHRNEMFSSMGNGFTFELESLLFYALARTTAYFCRISGVISVYGDDIIIPSSLFADLVWILGWFGFEVNSDKSFHTGSFRESCGGHFINGQDVTPFYLRGPIKTTIDLIHAANMLRKWSSGPLFNDSDAWPLWSSLANRIPRRLWGGHEYSSKLQLVSANEPDLTLWPAKKSWDTGDGGYIHWLSSTRDRLIATVHIVTSEATSVGEFYRLRRATRMVSKVRDLFLEELFSEEE